MQTQGNWSLIYITSRSKLQAAGIHRGDIWKALDRVVGALTPRVSARLLKHVSAAESFSCYFLLGFRHTKCPIAI